MGEYPRCWRHRNRLLQPACQSHSELTRSGLWSSSRDAASPADQMRRSSAASFSHSSRRCSRASAGVRYLARRRPALHRKQAAEQAGHSASKRPESRTTDGGEAYICCFGLLICGVMAGFLCKPPFSCANYFEQSSLCEGSSNQVWQAQEKLH
jgi:hypothetical protein